MPCAWAGACSARCKRHLAIRSLDCYRDVSTTFSMWLSVFTVGNYKEMFGSFADIGFDASNTSIIIAAIFAVCVVNFLLIKKESDLRVALREKPFLSYSLFALVLVLVLVFGAYGVGYDASDFIYKQF